MAGDLYREFEGKKGYQPLPGYDEAGCSSCLTFLRNNEAYRGPVDPRRGVPYYLLIVGSPTDIPFAFQSALGVDFAVGRIWFPEGISGAYRRYAESIVATETGPPLRDRTAAFFATRNPGDLATQQSHDRIVKPLLDDTRDAFRDWRLVECLRDLATKASLGRLLRSPERPAFLFTATHGVVFRNPSDARLAEVQGALVCQEWTGPRRGTRPEELLHRCVFAGADIPEGEDFRGLIAFLFGCCTVGTPRQRLTFHRTERESWRLIREPLSAQPWISAMAWRLLSNPGGAAAAVVGHVGEALAFDEGLQTSLACTPALRACIHEILRGRRVGAAMEEISGALAAFADAHAEDQQQATLGNPLARDSLPASGFAYLDARNYAIMGDPAARISVNPPTF
jgi:hypothetical protein